jgi:hypothetical protein
MPIGFAVIAIQLLYLSSNSKFYRGVMFTVILFWFVISYAGFLQELGWVVWIFGTLILVSLVYGMPIFIGLGGIAVLLFWKDFTPITAIPAETYRIVVSPSLSYCSFSFFTDYSTFYISWLYFGRKWSFSQDDVFF